MAVSLHWLLQIVYEVADKAVSAIEVEMELLPAVTTIEDALSKGDIIREIDYRYKDTNPYRNEKDLIVYKRHF